MKKELTYNEATEILANAPDGSTLDLDTSMDVIEAMSKVHQNDQVDDNWDNLFAMLDDMKVYAANNGRAIIQEDKPFQLRLGYRCTNTNKTWSIKITNMKRSLAEAEKSGNVDKALVFTMAMQTQQGKENLLKIINGN